VVPREIRFYLVTEQELEELTPPRLTADSTIAGISATVFLGGGVAWATLTLDSAHLAAAMAATIGGALGLLVTGFDAIRVSRSRSELKRRIGVRR
jgi:hypothetical protein